MKKIWDKKSMLNFSRQAYNEKVTDCHALFRILRFFELGCFLGRNIDLGGSFPTHDLKFGQLCDSKIFFFLAIPKTCISVLCVTRHNQVWGSKLIGITLHFYIGRLGLGCIFFFISLTFNYLVRSRLAERVTWLVSSRWGSPCSCE